MDTAILNYEITWDELELEGESKIPDSLKPLLQELHDDAINGKPQVIGRLRKLIKKYPSNLQLKNYLSAAYETTGNLNMAVQINDQILEEYPDYLFARINKASKLHADGQYEKIPELLGKAFDPQVLYPDRDIFHISEFLGIQGMAVRYFSAIGDLEKAKQRLQLMKEVDGNAPQSEMAEEVFYMATLSESLKRLAKEKEQRITPKNQFHLKKKEFKRPPFNVPATAELCRYELDIPEEVLQSFFDHDRDQVISDLENVLKDSYYNYNPEKNLKHSEVSFAPVHAFFILGDLEAEESLPVVLEMMEQNEDYFNDVFGDMFTEDGWMPLLKMGKDRLDLFAEYLRLPGTYTFFKTGVLEVLEQVWYHFPEKKDKVESVFGELIDYMNKAAPEDNVIDSEFNGFLTGSILNLKLVSLLPQVKKLYAKEYVSPSICGTYDEVKNEMFSTRKSLSTKRELKSTKMLYESITRPGKSPSRIDPPEQVIQPVVHTLKKVGRNDPCPCGSGKKYKKCCWNKN